MARPLFKATKKATNVMPTAGSVCLYNILTNLPPLAIDRHSDQVTMNWPVTPGVSCAVEQSLVLAPAQWSLLPHGRDNPYVGIVNFATAFFHVREVPPLTILQGPTSQIVGPGSNIVLQVQASGLEPLSHQWWFNGVPSSPAPPDRA